MKTKKNGLQKFTETEAKINKLFTLKQITPGDLKTLSDLERDYLTVVLTEKFNSLQGAERDNFYNKIEPITTDAAKNQIWENNHIQITWAISSLMLDYGRMPTKTEIATKTKLSRQTIHKHLKEYTNHPQYLQQIEQFRFMTSKVLARVYYFAVNGDMGAAKLYFNFMGNLTEGQTANKTSIQNQNNYIQINGTILSQETIKHLKPEQLNTVEAVLKTAIPQPEIAKE